MPPKRPCGMRAQRQYGHRAAIAALLELGADCAAKEPEGRNAHALAHARRRNTVIPFLEARDRR